VIIAEEVEWIAYAHLDARRNDLAGAIDSWRRDWESRDTVRLLSHYSPAFRTQDQDFRQFSEIKQRVNAGKDWIKVDLDSLSLMLYPERPDFAMVSFVQDYRSNNFSNRTVKRQFWSRENGRWKILHETQL